MRLVPLQARQSSTRVGNKSNNGDGDASFGRRRNASASVRGRQKETASRADGDEQHVFRKSDGSVEVSWVPPTPKFRSADAAEEDDLVLGGSGRRPRRQGDEVLRKGVERFGAGMEKGGEDPNMRVLSEQERSGRKQRRRGMRSGSKNAFRQASQK
jgi:ribosome biogenesis protein ENP2